MEQKINYEQVMNLLIDNLIELTSVNDTIIWLISYAEVTKKQLNELNFDIEDIDEAYRIMEEQANEEDLWSSSITASSNIINRM